MRNPTRFGQDDDGIERVLIAHPAGNDVDLEDETPKLNADQTTAKHRDKRRKLDPALIAANISNPPVLPYANAPALVPAPFDSPSNLKFFSTKGNPINKIGFRYTAATPAPHFTPAYPMYRMIQSQPIDTVRFSWEDRSLYCYLSEDASSITTDKGFRAARATVPLRGGTWYWECQIIRGGGKQPATGGMSGSHVRIGIARRESSLNAPVGIDGFSYGIRDRTGQKVHLAQPTAYGESFTTGDVIGVLLHLPPRDPPRWCTLHTKTFHHDTTDPAVHLRRRIPIKYKGSPYFESLEYTAAKEMTDKAEAILDALTPKVKVVRQKAVAPGQKYKPQLAEAPKRPLPTLEGSCLYFFKNGQPMGAFDEGSKEYEAAFQDLYDYLPLRQHPSTIAMQQKKKSVADRLLLARENQNDDGTIGYFPFASVFGGGIVRLNPGPIFSHPPAVSPAPSKVGPVDQWRPLNDRLADYMREETAFDEWEEEAAIPAIAAAQIAYDQQMKRNEEALMKSALAAKTLSKKKEASPAGSRAASLAARSVKNSDRSRSNTPVVVGHTAADTTPSGNTPSETNVEELTQMNGEEVVQVNGNANDMDLS